MGPVRLFLGHPGPPELPKMHVFGYCGPYLKNWWLCFCLVIHKSALWWGLTALKSPGFDIRAPQDPPNMKKFNCFSYLGFMRKKFLSDFSWDYFHILHVAGGYLWSAIYFKICMGPWRIHVYIKCLWVLLTHVYWFRATGDTFVVASDRAI